MRQRSGLRSVPAVAAWVSMSFLTACGTLGDGPGRGGERGVQQAQAVLDDEDDDDDCELLVVRRGGAAEIVEEKTPEMADPFYLLGSDRELLEQFQIEEEEEADCLVAFGIQQGGGLAPSAFGLAIPAPAIAGLVALIGAGIGIGAIAGGGGEGDGPTSTPSTL